MSEMTRIEALHMLKGMTPANTTLGRALTVAIDTLRDVVVSEAEAAAAATSGDPYPETALERPWREATGQALASAQKANEFGRKQVLALFDDEAGKLVGRDAATRLKERIVRRLPVLPLPELPEPPELTVAQEAMRDSNLLDEIALELTGLPRAVAPHASEGQCSTAPSGAAEKKLLAVVFDAVDSARYGARGCKDTPEKADRHDTESLEIAESAIKRNGIGWAENRVEGLLTLRARSTGGA